jgi:release factor glutamine methyltransferase
MMIAGNLSSCHPSSREDFSSSDGKAWGERTCLAALLPLLADRLATTLNFARREARLEAQILAAHALGEERAWLIAHDRDGLSPEQANAIEILVSRRELGEPIAYILGEKEFYGRLFKVTPAVLIPRPETELLVEAALERLPQGQPAKVLDLGTGSGCIAITISLERPNCDVLALDASTAALAVAEANARRLAVGNIQFLVSDWYSRLSTQRFDMILSNPPYIAASDPHLCAGDLRYEPRNALASGPHGLEALQILVGQSPVHLAAGGWLMFEHGYDQADACRDLLIKTGLEQVFTLSDLGGQARVTGGQWLRQP